MDPLAKTAALFYSCGTRMEAPAGTELFNASRDNNDDAVYFLDSGFCALTGIAPDGREHVFLYFPSPRLVGFMPYMPIRFDPEGAHTLITTKTDSVLWRVSGAQFQAILSREPLFQTYVLQVVAENYMDLIKHYQAGQSQCATSRLCGLLLRYAAETGGGRRQMPAYFNAAEFSRFLGVHAVTVSRIMTQLRQRGYIEKQGHRILLRDPEGLARLVREQTNFDF